ncbi:xanthine dehydrogenase family protein molybdopterin-binding subunit [Limnohabitans sp. B9-3]|uniref:xanthine dehydrogenase family protein molybdopterin-binding subunit n=1 Tax=Limnohabitans sp. B9-3 TaxID=1100707 RepID=UPI0018EB0945|nr:xanthine dehydrogenase family protein molybdopterin-binding subunit [Limnohabitans sp. B9-3]
MTHPNSTLPSGNAASLHQAKTNTLRREDSALLRGEGCFGQDVVIPNVCHIAFVRSPQAHAQLLGIQTDAALQIDGVLAVLTSNDLGQHSLPTHNPLLPVTQDTTFPLLALDRVAYVGQPVAIVVATSQAIAREAAGAVTLTLHTLPPSNDFASEDATTRTQHRSGQMPTNSAHVVEANIRSPRVSAMPMEPRACSARVHGIDATTDVESPHRITVWLGTQTPSRAQADVARVLNLPTEQVLLISPDVGGAFGAKASVSPEDLLTALTAQHLQRNVQWLASRSDDFVAGMQGRGSVLEGRLHVNAQGLLEGLWARLHFTLGAWLPFSAVVPLRNAARILPGPYALQHIDIEGMATRAHAAPVNIYRGAGRPEAALLMETLIEQAARRCDIDPVELRKRNLIAADAMPYTTPTGEVLDSGDYALALHKACEQFAYTQARADQTQRRREGEMVGIGMALYVEPCGQGWESARVILHEDGRVTVASGAPAQGQGHVTTFAQLAADTLGCAPRQVEVHLGNTELCPAGTGALASRSTAIGGSAIVQACRTVLARREGGEALPITAEEKFTASEAWSYGCVIAQMRIDVDTGTPTIERITWVDDAGHVLQPQLVHGQLIGGAAQGLGQAMMERLVYDDQGQLITGSLMDYAIPRADTMPPIHISSMHTPSPNNLLGAKGVGEAGCIGVPAALMNAARDALSPLGEFDLQLPLTSEQLWRVLSTHFEKETP